MGEGREVKGKVLEGVEFISSSDYDALILSFQDNTFADFIIETCFSLKAGYLDRNGGNHCMLKKWPRMGCGDGESTSSSLEGGMALGVSLSLPE